MDNRDICVINYSAPEMDFLASAIDHDGRLLIYVRRYINKGRPWEVGLQRVLGDRLPYVNEWQRRSCPPGLTVQRVRDAAVFDEFGRAVLARVPWKGTKQLERALHWRVQNVIARVGAREAAPAECVVASYVVAKNAFRACSGRKVLNYPIAHHQFIREFVAEEREREPMFARTLPNWDAEPAWLVPRLDEECERADEILVGSTFARDSFVGVGIASDKVQVVPYGVDISGFSPAQASAGANADNANGERFRLLFVGQVGQRKGLSYLLRAYEAFVGPGTSFTIVGSFVGAPDTFLPFRHLFHHIPNQPRSRLADIYRSADVFVFPTLIEGMPLVVLEAMASGLPVITTRNGAQDIVRDGVDGFLVPIRDSEAIVEKLEYLRAHPGRRAEMGKSARARAQQFSWSRYQTAVLDVLFRGKRK